MTKNVAILHVHRASVLLHTIYLRRSGRTSRLDCLYHDNERIDVGILRLYLSPSPRWCADHICHISRIDITRADGHSIGCPDGQATATQGDVLTIDYPNHPTYTFTLAEIAPLNSDRGLVISLLALAEEQVGEEQRSLLFRAAAKLGDAKACETCEGSGTWLPRFSGSNRRSTEPRRCPDCNGIGEAKS